MSKQHKVPRKVIVTKKELRYLDDVAKVGRKHALWVTGNGTGHFVLYLDKKKSWADRALKEFRKMDPIDLPWKPTRSRQMDGMATEKKIAKKKGARVHPRSGAGHIKDDASNESTVIEIKDAGKTHTLNAADLDGLFKRANAQGKDAEYVVYFGSKDLTATIHLQRGMP